MSSMKEYIAKSISKGKRFDDRKNDEYREVIVETNVIKNAEGSARVKIGDTEVLAGVKMSLETPYPDTPEDGNLMVNEELTPLSSPEFESGPPNDESVEMARVVDRGIRESEAIDTKKLCLKKGEKVWMVSIDIVSVNDGGNLIDASALAAVAALKQAKLPKIVDDVVEYKELTKDGLPLNEDRLPVTITAYKIGENIILDPTVEEREASEARLSVAVMKDGNLVALQKGGDTPLSAEEINNIADMAIRKAKELRKKVE